MQLAFHLGVHCTGDDALYQSLDKSRSRLAEHRVRIVEPADPFPLSAACGPDEGEADGLPAILDEFCADGSVERVLFCSEHLMGSHSRPVGDGRLYPDVGARAGTLASRFSAQTIEFHVALRSPATLLPTLICRGDPLASEIARDPEMLVGLSWADLVERLCIAAPAARVVVWCDEDMPLIWPEVLDRVAGVEGTGQAGFYDRIGPLLTEDGLERLRLYLAAHPPRDAEQRRAIVSSFLGRFGRPEAIEMELDLPGWTPEIVGAISEAYEIDVDRIAAMPRVEMIQP